jgi:prolyl-tRNA synthetase
VAPFLAVIVPVNMSDTKIVETTNKIYDQLISAKFDVLLDDRDESAGIKFADADLIGIPYRITIGRKIVEGKIEIMERRTRKTYDIEIERVKDFFEKIKDEK